MFDADPGANDRHPFQAAAFSAISCALQRDFAYLEDMVLTHRSVSPISDVIDQAVEVWKVCASDASTRSHRSALTRIRWLVPLVPTSTYLRSSI